MKRDSRGNLNSWAESAYDIASEYRGVWIRVASDMESSGYRVTKMKVPTEPRWPKESFEELLALAFKRRTITSRDHPIILQQLGEE
jgi:hypothetical protein